MKKGIVGRREAENGERETREGGDESHQNTLNTCVKMSKNTFNK